MASGFGDFTAKYVRQGVVQCDTTSWTALVTSGTTPLEGRRHIRIFPKSKQGHAIALAYVTKNADGTFTTATDSVGDCTIYAGNTKIIEPISDVIQVFGRMVNKAGTTDTSARVIITEYR